MTTINPVDLDTLGARVTDPAQLTTGRWYAVRVNCSGTRNPLVHAQYMGRVGRSLREFEVCDEDLRALEGYLCLVKRIHREDSSIRTGKINGGGVCEVFKFKQVKDEPVSIPRKSPYSTGNCRDNGIKEGDKFVVVSDSGRVAKGTIVTLTRDDGSLCPYFEVPGRKTSQAIHLWRLAPVSATGRMQASAPAIQNIPKSVGVRPVVKEVSPYEDSDYATCARYGIKVGDKFKVINADGHNGLSVGAIVTLSEDDGSPIPYFVRNSTGEEVCIRLCRLVPMVANPSNASAPTKKKARFNKVGSPYSKESTCLTEGIKEGDLFVVVCPFAAFPVGTRVRLFADDGTHAPEFKAADGSIPHAEYINLSRLQPCPQEEAAALNAAATSPVVISTVDQLKSEIDALNAQISQKNDAVTQLVSDVDRLQVAVEDVKQTLRAQLQGYI